MVAERTRHPHCRTRVRAKIYSSSGGRLFVVALRAFTCTPGVDFMTSMDPKAAARRVADWLKSTPGAEATRRAQEQVLEVERLLGESRNISIKSLKERFTI